MSEVAFRRMEQTNFLAAFVAAALSLFLFSRPVAIGVAAGAILMAVDVYSLRKLVFYILSGGSASKAFSIFFLSLKFGLFFVVAYGCLKYLPMNVIGFAAGVGIVLLTASFVGHRITQEN